MEKYPIAYKIDIKPHTKEELTEAGLGGCDAIIIHSILFPSEGNRSEAIISYDGTTNEELSGNQMFQSWIMMAHSLSENEKLDPSKRELANTVLEVVRQSITNKNGD